jgi:hypothetical protein
LIQLLLEVLNGNKRLVVKELGLEQTKEVLDHTIIITIAFPGHALDNAFFL